MGALEQVQQVDSQVDAVENSIISSEAISEFSSIPDNNKLPTNLTTLPIEFPTKQTGNLKPYQVLEGVNAVHNFINNNQTLMGREEDFYKKIASMTEEELESYDNWVVAISDMQDAIAIERAKKDAEKYSRLAQNN